MIEISLYSTLSLGSLFGSSKFSESCFCLNGRPLVFLLGSFRKQFEVCAQVADMPRSGLRFFDSESGW